MVSRARTIGNLQFAAYAAGVSGLLGVMADEAFDLRKWKQTAYEIHRRSRADAAAAAPIHLSVRCRTRPPPIGCMEWPAGRVLLQWALDEGEMDDDGVVLEVGAGIGLTAIGLAVSRAARGNKSPVYATDMCDGTLSLLRENADAMHLSNLHVAKWDAASGASALTSLPCPISEITHVVGADVVYYGFGHESDGSGRGLEHTIAALLREKPDLRVSLLVIDRFSGGAVAVLSTNAGVNVHAPPTTVDPAVSNFLTTLDTLGLRVTSSPLPPDVIQRVRSSQGWLARITWWLAGHYDGMTIVTVRPQ